MQRFEFNGNWEIKMNFEKFNESNSKWDHNNKTLNDQIYLKIIDKKTLIPDPLDEQINTIHYLIENQEEVLAILCKAFNVINIKYGECSGEHDWYPANLTKYELGKVFFITEIAILVEHKEESSYIQFSGEYKGDYEHGIVVVIHKDKLIGFDQIGEDVDSEIYSDLGDQKDEFRNFNIQHQDFGTNQVHQPIPKYGKHKPWQLDATVEYLENLIRAKKNEEFISEFSKSKLDVNYRFPFVDRSVIEIAVTHKNINVIDHLIKQGANASNSLIKCTYRDSFDLDTINCLLANGVSIDTITNNGMTPLGLEVKNYIWYISSLRHYKIGDRRIESALKEIENAKEKIKFYIGNGANPYQIDKNGNSYKSILLKDNNQEQLKKYKAYTELEKIFNPDSPKSNKWKFWKN